MHLRTFIRKAGNSLCAEVLHKWSPSLLNVKKFSSTASLYDTSNFTTITEARRSLQDVVGGTKKLIGEDQNETAIIAPIAETQEELPIRRMLDSYSELRIPLSDIHARQKYLNPTLGIRYGRIMEDLDTFAVHIGYKHALFDKTKKAGISIVTALVDRIEIQNRIEPHMDIKMSGNVTWAGKSSMEITMKLEQETGSTYQTVLDAKFLMVSRNPATKKAAVVCSLKPQSAEEEKIFQLGEANKQCRQKEAQRNLLKTAPSEAERETIHQLFLQTLNLKSQSLRDRVKPENSVWMEKAVLKNLHICFPESRNLYNKIFGGYLMRKAFELAWANAALYCSTRNFYLTVVDDIAFLQSVEIGSLLLMSSQVVYTKGQHLQLHVHAEKIDPDNGSRATTNNFYFTFHCPDKVIPTIMPKTYAEYMLYLDGKRHFES